MDESLIIKPLICEYCGSQLPVMEESVVFQCAVCFQHWVLAGQNLKPINVHRAFNETETDENQLYLPFWVVEIDRGALIDNIKKSVKASGEIKQRIASTEVETDNFTPPDITNLTGQPDPALNKFKFISNASRAVKMPHPFEIKKIINNIESRERFYIYVPAFYSRNTYTYLKVGRLMTRLQPSYSITDSFHRDQPSLCALQPEESLPLLDFVFISTLPESVQGCWDFIGEIKLKPLSPPTLIEFPYLEEGSYMKSMIGNFQISYRLVESAL